MDQLCHGLERFQVLECIRKNPTVFEPGFVYIEEREPFISVFEIDKFVFDEQKQNIYEYLSKADATTQRKILFFSTGSNVRPYLYKKVKVKAADGDAIFGSTCTNTIAMRYLVAPAPTRQQGDICQHLHQHDSDAIFGSTCTKALAMRYLVAPAPTQLLFQSR